MNTNTHGQTDTDKQTRKHIHLTLYLSLPVYLSISIHIHVQVRDIKFPVPNMYFNKVTYARFNRFLVTYALGIRWLPVSD